MSRRPVFSALMSSVAAILILAAGCTDLAPTAARLDTDFNRVELPSSDLRASFSRIGATKQVIGPEGGEIQMGRVSLRFPAGALAEPTEISLAPDSRYLGVTFGPHGLQFPEGNGPTLRFDYGGIADLPAQDLQILYVSGQGAVLERLAAAVDTNTKTVFTNLRHFSAYTVATP